MKEMVVLSMDLWSPASIQRFKNRIRTPSGTMCAAKVYDNLFHGTCLYVTSCLKYTLDFIREHLVPYEESGESLDPVERQCAAHCPEHLFHESGCPAGTASFTDKKKPHNPHVFANPRTSDAPPGARTLDTLIKRKGVQTCFLQHKFILINSDPARCVSTCSTISPSSHGISCQVLIYFPGMICYNGLAVDSFQQEGGEHNARSHRLYFFHHSKCNVTLHMQVAGWR